MKTWMYWGLGIVAIAALAYFVYYKKKAVAQEEATVTDPTAKAETQTR